MEIATIAAIGAITSAVGTGVSAYGQMQQAKELRKQERIRRRQMDLEAARRRQRIIREAAAQRAQSTVIGYAQGAGGSSSLAGAQGAIMQQAGSNVLATQQGAELGRQMFAANMAEANAAMIGNIGQGIGSLGSLAMGLPQNQAAVSGLRNLGVVA